MSKATNNFVEKCKQFWQEADVDGNGLSVGELAKIIRRASNVDITDQDIAQIFMDMDDNNDKIMSWDEFSDVFKKKDPKKVQESELMEVFKGIDKDGSGVLSACEIKAEFSAIGASISEEDLEDLISKADADSDGKINYQEFLKGWSA